MADSGNHSEAKHWFLTRRWMTVAPIMLLLWIIGQIDKTHISLIIADKNFLQELSLFGHNEELGGLMSTFFIGYGIAIFLWGFLVDRFGARACAIVGTFCWAAVLFLSSRVGGIREYLLIRLLLGLAEGNLWPVCNALTNRWFPAREHSRIQAFWVTGSTLGTAVGVPVVTALMLASGWRGALASLSLVSLLPVVFFVFLRNSPAESRSISRAEFDLIETGRKPQGAVVPLRFAEMFRSSPFWLIAVCQVVSATTIYTLVQWIPSYVTRFRQLPLKEMAPWLTAGYLIATALTLLAGYVADRTMQRSLTGLWTCLLFAIIILPSASQWWSAEMNALLLAALIAAAASTAALNGALMHALVRPEAIARGTGIVWGIANFASAAGPAIFGRLITSMGGEYWAGFFFLGLLNLAGVICYATLHRITKRSLSREAVAVPSRQAAVS
jgi:MFS transporter, ACS family, glucarate transporter